MSLRKNKVSGKSVSPLLVPRSGGGIDSLTKLGASSIRFDNTPFWQAQSILVGVNALGFGISLATGSHLHLDLLGAGAFALAALVPWFRNGKNVWPVRVQWSSAAVVLWGTKLASFLFYRALHVRHDARLDELLSTVNGTASFWIVSVLWGIFTSLPHTLGTTSLSPGNRTFLQLGGALYSVGLIIETLADYQKWVFKQTNPGQFCNSGLWSISQHPNMFGDLLLWCGILVMNGPALIGPPSPAAGGSLLGKITRFGRLALACVSPLFLWTIFSGQAHGTLTNTVALSQAKYGHDPAFQEYIQTVPLIIPNPFHSKLVEI